MKLEERAKQAADLHNAAVRGTIGDKQNGYRVLFDSLGPVVGRRGRDYVIASSTLEVAAQKIRKQKALGLRKKDGAALHDAVCFARAVVV